jgi:hypothetical protein
MRTIDQIIEAAGGRTIVAEQLRLKDGVRKWPEIGIPDRHWPGLIALVPDLTADELMQANIAARQGAAA